MKVSPTSKKTRPARWLALPVVAVLCALAPEVRAAPVDQATRAAARAAAEEALAKFDKGDYAGALDLFERADALVHAPTLGLMAARCLEKLGRLVDASERYLAVTKVHLEPGAPDAQAKALVTAGEERAALLPRVPSLVITVEGAKPAEASVTIDGTAVPAALLGLKRPTDPGKHQLKATRGSQVVSREVTLKPGDATAITLSFTAGAAPPDSGGKPDAPPPPDQPGEARGLGTMGWVGVGVAGLGGVGLVVGAITGGLAVGAKSSLDSAGCAGGFCPTSQQSQVSKYNTLRVTSGAMLITGGLLAAGGTALVVVVTRSRAKPQQAKWSPWVSALPGTGVVAGGVAGAF